MNVSYISIKLAKIIGVVDRTRDYKLRKIKLIKKENFDITVKALGKDKGNHIESTFTVAEG